MLYTGIAHLLNGYVCAVFPTISFYLNRARCVCMRVWLWVKDIDREENVLCFRQRTFKWKSSADSKSCTCGLWNQRERERIPVWKILLIKRESFRLPTGMTQRWKTFYLFANTFLYLERTSSGLLRLVLGAPNCVLTFRSYIPLSSLGFLYC